MDRTERRDRWEASFSPNRLALAGAAVSISLLIQPNLSSRIVILAFAIAAAHASGRRLSPMLTIMVMIGIIGANLLVPMGRKLAEFGPLVITEIAFLEGLEKAVTFEALIFISKACLSPGLRFPGPMGSLFAEAFKVYDRILEHRGQVHMKTLMKDIDGILNSVYYGEKPGRADMSGEVSNSTARQDIIDLEQARHPGDRFLPLVVGLALLAFFV